MIDTAIFEINGKKATFKLLQGVVSIKAGGGYISMSQYYAMHPPSAEKERSSSATGTENRYHSAREPRDHEVRTKPVSSRLYKAAQASSSRRENGTSLNKRFK